MYNYQYQVLEDVKQYINDNINLNEWKDDRDGLESQLYDDLFCDDSVTGNGSGSYTFNSYKAWDNLNGNLDLLGEALSEFGCDDSYILKQGAEACDVTIRCYLLGGAISEALDELMEA